MSVSIIRRHPSGRIDWASARDMYIKKNLYDKNNNKYQLKDLAEDLGACYGTVRNHAYREKWDEQLEKAYEDRELGIKAQMERNRQQLADSLQADELNNELTVRKRQANVARVLQSKAAAKLQLVKPEELSVREAIELMRLGLIEERKALGMPDKHEFIPDGSAPPSSHVSTDRARAVLGRVIDLVEKRAGVYGEATADAG